MLRHKSLIVLRRRSLTVLRWVHDTILVFEEPVDMCVLNIFQLER